MKSILIFHWQWRKTNEFEIFSDRPNANVIRRKIDLSHLLFVSLDVFPFISVRWFEWHTTFISFLLNQMQNYAKTTKMKINLSLTEDQRCVHWTRPYVEQDVDVLEEFFPTMFLSKQQNQTIRQSILIDIRYCWCCRIKKIVSRTIFHRTQTCWFRFNSSTQWYLFYCFITLTFTVRYGWHRSFCRWTRKI